MKTLLRSCTSTAWALIVSAVAPLRGVALSDFCWSIVLIKEHLWAFLQRQGSRHGPA